jgi:hypothetical protein
MSRYDRFRYRVSVKWIVFYFWVYRKLSGFRTAIGLNTMEKVPVSKCPPDQSAR